MASPQLRAAYRLARTLKAGVRYDQDWRWKFIAHQVRVRDRFKCRRCHQAGWHVHHKKPVSKGGGHSPRNLETLCPACHQKEHPWMKNA